MATSTFVDPSASGSSFRGARKSAPNWLLGFVMLWSLSIQIHSAKSTHRTFPSPSMRQSKASPTKVTLLSKKSGITCIPTTLQRSISLNLRHPPQLSASNMRHWIRMISKRENFGFQWAMMASARGSKRLVHLRGSPTNQRGPGG